MKSMILSVDPGLEEATRQNYVTFKKNGNNTVSLWPKSGWLEVVLNAKTGQLNDPNELLYDITARKWTAAHYAFRFYDDSDLNAVKYLVEQTIALKK